MLYGFDKGCNESTECGGTGNWPKFYKSGQYNSLDVLLQVKYTAKCGSISGATTPMSVSNTQES